MRGALKPLTDVAAAMRVAVVMVSHLTKDSKGNTSVLYRVTGSLAYVAASRAVFVVAKDRDDPERRLVLPLKMNLSKDQGLAFAYRLIDENGVPRIEWEKEAVETNAEEQFNSNKDQYDGEVEAWLTELLSTGQKESVRVWKEAEERKFSKQRVERVKKKLGIRSIKEHSEDGRDLWYFVIPEGKVESPRSRQRRQPTQADWLFMKALAAAFVDEPTSLGLRSAGELADLCARKNVAVPEGRPGDSAPLRIGGVMARCFGQESERKIHCSTDVGPREVKARRTGSKGSWRYEFYEGAAPPEPATDAM